MGYSFHRFLIYQRDHAHLSVTSGEMLDGPARLLLMDETSIALDSSTTFWMSLASIQMLGVGWSMVVCNTFGSFILVIVMVLGGFVLSGGSCEFSYTRITWCFCREGSFNFPDGYWYWLGVGSLLGFVFLYSALFIVALGIFYYTIQNLQADMMDLGLMGLRLSSSCWFGSCSGLLRLLLASQNLQLVPMLVGKTCSC